MYKTGTRSLPPAVINPGSDVCRAMALSIRAVERNAKDSDIAHQYLNRAIDVFAASPFFPKPTA
jgi:hypothetical protein